MSNNQILEFMMEQARQAGQKIREDFGARILGVSAGKEWKTDNTPVTPVDIFINQQVMAEAKRRFPHIAFYGEEGDRAIDGAEQIFITDPLDGTIPHIAGFPIGAFCMAHLDNGVPTNAVIYEPFTNRLWTASVGCGTFMNGMRVHVSSQRELRRSVIGLIWWEKARFNLGKISERIMAEGAKWINPVSVAIMGGLIASGQMEASIFPSHKQDETGAMQLIVKEAGGIATDIHGNPLVYELNRTFNGHIISNGYLHRQLMDIVQNCQD